MGRNPIRRNGRPASEDGDDRKSEIPEIAWIPADESPWRVPVLDVRPLTQTMLSTSSDPTCAANAVSFGPDDGTSFIGVEPAIARTTPASIRYRRDRLVADGVLFTPDSMEHKWAIFHHRGTLIFVRSWTREVVATARLVQSGDIAEVTEIRGALPFGTQESPDLTVRSLDFLLRSHVLGLVWPVPLAPGQESDPKRAAMYCMSAFGKLALVATPAPVTAELPTKSLRSQSLLHIAVARGDRDAVDEQLAEGIPVDLLAGDGLAPLHWALSTKGTSMLEHLLSRRSPVDVRSAEGATPLMSAIQGDDLAQIEFFLSHGADASASDARGFTSLHRAAEMGHLRAAELLLASGAYPYAEAQGQSPLSLAEQRGHEEIVRILRR